MCASRDIPAAAALPSLPRGSPVGVPTALSRSKGRPTCQPLAISRRQWWPPTTRPACRGARPGSAAGPGAAHAARGPRCGRPIVARWCCCSQPAYRLRLRFGHAESPAVTAATISECSLCREAGRTRRPLACGLVLTSGCISLVSRIKMSINATVGQGFSIAPQYAVKLLRRQGQTGRHRSLCARTARSLSMPRFVDMLCGKRPPGSSTRRAPSKVTDGGAQVFEIDDHGAGSGPGIWLDEQPAVRSTTHSCHLMVLSQGSFAQRSTHAKRCCKALSNPGCFRSRPAAADDNPPRCGRRLRHSRPSGSVLISNECTVLAGSRARAGTESPKIQDFEAILRLLAQPGDWALANQGIAACHGIRSAI